MKTYIAMSIALAAFVAVGANQHFLRTTGYGSDDWCHAAAIESVDGRQGWSIEYFPVLYVSNWHRFMACIRRIVGCRASDLMAAAAAVHMAVWLIGVWMFARWMRIRRPAILLATLLLCWGIPWQFSTVYALGNLPLVAMYPCWLAAGLWMILFASAHRIHPVILAPIIAVLIDLHPITAIFAGPVFFATMLREDLEHHASASAIGAALTLVLFPTDFAQYTDVVPFCSAMSMHDGLLLRAGPPLVIVLFFMACCGCNGEYDDMLSTAIVVMAVWVCAHQTATARLIVGVIFIMHMKIAREVDREWGAWKRSFITACIIALVLQLYLTTAWFTHGPANYTVLEGVK